MLFPLDVNEAERKRKPNRVIRSHDKGLETRITSKRRSPWLCPAPSGGAGLFYFSCRKYGGFRVYGFPRIPRFPTIGYPFAPFWVSARSKPHVIKRRN